MSRELPFQGSCSILDGRRFREKSQREACLSRRKVLWTCAWTTQPRKRREIFSSDCRRAILPTCFRRVTNPWRFPLALELHPGRFRIDHQTSLGIDGHDKAKLLPCSIQCLAEALGDCDPSLGVQTMEKSSSKKPHPLSPTFPHHSPIIIERGIDLSIFSHNISSGSGKGDDCSSPGSPA